MELVGPIFDILNCVGPPLCRCIEYHRKLDEYKKILERKLNELKSQKEEIELRLRVECRYRKLPKVEVKNWLEDAHTIIHDAENIEHTVGKRKCFSRARLGKLVDKKIQEVKECCQKGCLFNSLVIDAPPAIGIEMQTTMFVGETTTKKDMDVIWEYLMGNEVKKIGVCGMGGVGKTTIMKDINNRLLKETDKFDIVIWITVSQTVDILKLQNEIATALDEKLEGIEEKLRRAEILSKKLKGRRFVLIMDDVWEKIQLEELGVPKPTEGNKCKLVITTRSLDVCRFMSCTPVKVRSLSEKEALELFLERVELDISKLPTLKEKVELVVKECAGLPLAIVTIAGSMKREDDIRVWNNALYELSNNIKSSDDMTEEIFGRLKFSYDRLKDEKVQNCFLYCALYPEDYDIPKSELVDCWIAEGHVDEMDNLQATEDRAHIIMKRLINSCLLLESTDYIKGSCVKLHDVVRDMVLTYITRKSPLFMVKAGLNLEELPDAQEWKENVEKISLMKNSIREIPFGLSPNSQKLSTLFLQKNPLESIPETFFVHLKGLKILNLSDTEIQNLPDSIFDLTNLTSLLLERCDELKNIPSLAKLSALKNLNLEGTSIEKVPEGLEMLTNLRNLNLYSKKLRELPIGILPKLRYLQKFKMYWGSETLQPTVEEAARLRKLDTFATYFENLHDLKCYIKCVKVHNQVPNKYSITRNPIGFILNKMEVDKSIALCGCNICEREDSIMLLEDVQSLQLYGCDDVISISNVPSFNTLERLEVLDLQLLDNLTALFEVSKLPLCPYSNLKSLSIFHCPKLNNVFSSKLLPQLKNLEEITVNLCYGMEEIIAVDVDDQENSTKELNLPKLRRLSLTYMDELKSLWGSNGVMACDSLQEIEIVACPKLKRLPFRLAINDKGEPSSPPALNKIIVEREWWEALEYWDHRNPNSKTLLLPYCHFY